MDKERIRHRWTTYIRSLQQDICQAFEDIDGKGHFRIEEWQRGENGTEGGGSSRIISDGAIFEKGAVNISVVYGRVSEQMREHLGMHSDFWFAGGLSLIMHPVNPFIPTVHANWRYLELTDQKGAVVDRWFGGGTDLTPYYLFEEDARHFHQTLKAACDPYGEELYPRYKQECDLYFRNTHRKGEARGIGGVFYDHLRPDGKANMEQLLAFQKANGNCFLKSYLPIIERRKEIKWDEKKRYWQQIRRGRYVEFNLLHDRGTLFGLKSDGRIESILVSLPPVVRFDYDYRPKQGSEEEKLLKVCQNPRDWA